MTRERVSILATKRQAEAIRALCTLMEKHMPYRRNVRSVMWPEIEVALRVAMNIENARRNL